MTVQQPQPTVTPRLEEPKLGFNEYAERLNGQSCNDWFCDNGGD